MTALLAGFGAAVLIALGVRTLWSGLLKSLDDAAGSAIVAFGGLLAWRTLRESS